MSDDKKYYYLKLKDNYFDQDNIKVLESLPNGHLYSLIILKLYVKACKYNGQLKMTDSIPYDPSKIDILAKVINHDQDNVKEAVKNSIALGLISLMESGEMWMTEIQNYIGHSSTEGDRKKIYRDKIKNNKLLTMGQCPDIRTPEIEIEIEIDKDIDKEIEKKKDIKKKIIADKDKHTELRKEIISVIGNMYFDLYQNKLIFGNKEIGIIKSIITKTGTRPDKIEFIKEKLELYKKEMMAGKQDYFKTFTIGKFRASWDGLVDYEKAQKLEDEKHEIEKAKRRKENAEKAGARQSI